MRTILTTFIIAALFPALAFAAVHHLPPHYYAQKYNRIVTNNLPINLDQPANVKIYRGKDLVSDQQVKAGKQFLDTKGLPMGIYQVTIEVHRNGKKVSSTKKKFIKEVPDQDQVLSSLNVDLMQPATVKVSKGDQILYHHQFKNSGFYKIATDDFPKGTYPVILKVKNDDGSYSYQNLLFFTKPKS